MKPVVFLDRDGVLNHAPVRGGKARAPHFLADFQITDEAAPSVRRLQQAGYHTVVITNQPEVARGRIAAEELTAMHRKLQDEVHVDEVLFCPHQDGDGCDCRKPAPGMLQGVLARPEMDAGRCFLIGDTWRDVGAGQRAGCFTILLDNPHSGDCAPDRRVDRLTEAVDLILDIGARP